MSETKKSFTWGAVQSAQPVSLADVMSEELAEHLTHQELESIVGKNEPCTDVEDFPDSTFEAEESTTDDFLIAQLLQKQFDKEFDENLHVEEKHHNRGSKVRVSYSKYRMVPEDVIWDDTDDEEDEDLNRDDKKRDWDIFETNDKEAGIMPRRGYKMQGEKMVTKHDKELSQRTNAKRIMEFPPGIHTGDGGGFDMQISNNVYNKIRDFSNKEDKRKYRITDKEERAVAEQAVDPKTRVLLFKLVNGGILDSINGVVSTGKEAVIMHADGGPGPDEGPEIPLNVPKECAVKVFKTTLNEFKTREKYIKDDYRFKDRFGKQNPRKIIHMWAEKELHNLMKMAKGGIRVPEVVVLKKHVLVMSFIGVDGQPAPKLKDAVSHMSKATVEAAYQQVVEMMVDLYNKCSLVHADLSEYNILWSDGECWFIDVSQSVEPIHSSGLNFLFRDATNISNFFSKWGVPEVMTGTQLFNKITGLELQDGSESELLSQINAYQKDQLLKSGLENEEVHGGQSSFEYCWNESLKGMPSTPARPIPGHHRSKSDKSGYKSPRSPKSPKSPGCGGKSPGSEGKSPCSGGKSPYSDLIAMSDASLSEFKAELVNDKTRSEEASSNSVIGVIKLTQQATLNEKSESSIEKKPTAVSFQST